MWHKLHCKSTVVTKVFFYLGGDVSKFVSHKLPRKYIGLLWGQNIKKIMLATKDLKMFYKDAEQIKNILICYPIPLKQCID